MGFGERARNTTIAKTISVHAAFRMRWRSVTTAEERAKAAWGSGGPGFESRHPDHFFLWGSTGVPPAHKNLRSVRHAPQHNARPFRRASLLAPPLSSAVSSPVTFDPGDERWFQCGECIRPCCNLPANLSSCPRYSARLTASRDQTPTIRSPDNTPSTTAMHQHDSRLHASC